MKTNDTECPLLTVSVAAHNAEEWLGRCLDSCLGFGGGLDVIVVDDGSTDGTAVLADRYAEAYPDTFRVIHKKNGHYGSTVNASLAVARGKYYRLLDSDDWFDYEGMKHWLSVLSETRADVAVTSSVRIMWKSGDETKMDPCEGVPSGEYGINELPVDEVPGPGISNLAWRTDFLRDTGIELLECCNYVDEELRCVPWCHIETVRVDHIPVYCVLKERDGQSTSLEGRRRSVGSYRRMLVHLMDQADLGDPEKRSRAQKMALEVVVRNVAAGEYGVLLLLPSTRDSKKKVEDYDRWLKGAYPELYRLTGRNRTIRALRVSRFALYRFLAKRRARRWRY